MHSFFSSVVPAEDSICPNHSCNRDCTIDSYDSRAYPQETSFVRLQFWIVNRKQGSSDLPRSAHAFINALADPTTEIAGLWKLNNKSMKCCQLDLYMVIFKLSHCHQLAGKTLGFECFQHTRTARHPQVQDTAISVTCSISLRQVHGHQVIPGLVSCIFQNLSDCRNWWGKNENMWTIL